LSAWIHEYRVVHLAGDFCSLGARINSIFGGSLLPHSLDRLYHSAERHSNFDADRRPSENSPLIATRLKSSESHSLTSKHKKLVPGEGQDAPVDGSTGGEETAEAASNSSIGHYEGTTDSRPLLG
jgi:hypothetical protein